MGEENEETINQWIKQCVANYERLFEPSGDGVLLSNEELIPLDEMRSYLEIYAKRFDDSIEEQKRKLAKLKKIREGWKLPNALLDKLIAVREKQLGQTY